MVFFCLCSVNEKPICLLVGPDSPMSRCYDVLFITYWMVPVHKTDEIHLEYTNKQFFFLTQATCPILVDQQAMWSSNLG